MLKYWVFVAAAFAFFTWLNVANGKLLPLGVGMALVYTLCYALIWAILSVSFVRTIKIYAFWAAAFYAVHCVIVFAAIMIPTFAPHAMRASVAFLALVTAFILSQIAEEIEAASSERKGKRNSRA